MQKTLLTNAPSIEERTKKAKTSRRGQGASGRLHRTEAGDWVWSSDEDDNPEKETTNAENCVSNSSPQQTSDKTPEVLTPNQTNQSAGTATNDTEVKSIASNASNPINLVLRIRNSKKELNDIRFEFTVDKGLSLQSFYILIDFKIKFQ